MYIKRYKYIILLAVLYVLIFQNILQEYCRPFQYLDELFVIAFGIEAIIALRKMMKGFEIPKWIILVCVLLGCIIVIGLLGNVIYQYQVWKSVIPDLAVFCKYFSAIFVGYMLEIDECFFSNNNLLRKNLNRIVFIWLVMAVLYVFMNGTYVGMLPLKLFYGHPTFLAASCSVWLSLSLTASRTKKDQVFEIIVWLMLILTLRSKAYAIAFIFAFIRFFTVERGLKIDLLKIAGLAGVSIFIAWNKIIKYFVVFVKSARNVLYKYSLILAHDHFPVGTGFGSFASYFSGTNYSKVYPAYNLDHVEGLIWPKCEYISDSFWPMILGQFGIIGLILYISVLGIIFLQIQKLYLNSSRIYAGALFAFIYLLVVSIAESAFVNSYSVMFGFITGICLSCKADKGGQLI